MIARQTRNKCEMDNTPVSSSKSNLQTTKSPTNTIGLCDIANRQVRPQQQQQVENKTQIDCQQNRQFHGLAGNYDGSISLAEKEILFSKQSSPNEKKTFFKTEVRLIKDEDSNKGNESFKPSILAAPNIHISSQNEPTHNHQNYIDNVIRHSTSKSKFQNDEACSSSGIVASTSVSSSFNRRPASSNSNQSIKSEEPLHLSPLRSKRKVPLRNDGSKYLENKSSVRGSSGHPVSPSYTVNTPHTRRSSLSAEIRGSLGSVLQVEGISQDAYNDHRVSSADMSITQFACADDISASGQNYAQGASSRFAHGGITIASKANLPFSDDNASEDDYDDLNQRMIRELSLENRGVRMKKDDGNQSVQGSYGGEAKHTEVQASHNKDICAVHGSYGRSTSFPGCLADSTNPEAIIDKSKEENSINQYQARKVDYISTTNVNGSRNLSLDCIPWCLNSKNNHSGKVSENSVLNPQPMVSRTKSDSMVQNCTGFHVTPPTPSFLIFNPDQRRSSSTRHNESLPAINLQI